jgi:lysophospholipase L1-like esterase
VFLALDLNVVVPANEGGRIYRPIETFGQLYLQADGFHTNVKGYELIALAVREAVIQAEKFKSAQPSASQNRER